MEFEDIVVGSGLAALGAVVGLEHSRHVLVLCGPLAGRFSHYDARRTVPCAYHGEGGLGNDWHGVIPTGWQTNFAGSSDAAFAALFERFYPGTHVLERLGQPWLFVPWKPIRPRREFARLKAERQGRFTLVHESAENFRFGDRSVEVMTSTGTHRARRLWIAAGALHTPRLLDRAMGRQIGRGLVSDHVTCYVGHVDGLPAPRIAHCRAGAYFPAIHGVDVLYTLRPARFDFRQLDQGIEQRAVFGLPTGNAIAKIARRMTPGLLTEAFYNRFGLFAGAPRYSIYAQVLVRDAYDFGDGDVPLRARVEAIRAATDLARSRQPFAEAILSQRPELSIPGIHLHHSLDLAVLAAAGINQGDSPVRVVDASALRDIGAEHQSFKVMVAACERARPVRHG